MRLIADSSKTRLRNAGNNESSEVVYTEEVTSSPDTTVEEMLSDAVVDSFTYSSITKSFHINTDLHTAEWVSGAGSVSDGVVTGTGPVVVKLTNLYGVISFATFYPESGGAGTSKTFKSFVGGSLADHCNNQLLSRIQAATGTLDNQLSISDGMLGWNSDCWGADLDFSGFSLWNSRGGTVRNVSLIGVNPEGESRHVIATEHWKLAVGDTIRFLSTTGNVVERTIARVFDGSVTRAEFSIMSLTSPITTADNVTPFKVMNIENWFPRIPSELGLYGYFLMQYAPESFKVNYTPTNLNFARINRYQKLYIHPARGAGAGAFFTNENSIGEDSYRTEALNYDSNTPMFMVVNGECALRALSTFAVVGTGYITGWGMSQNNGKILSFMQELNSLDGWVGNDQTLQDADLSAFPSYESVLATAVGNSYTRVGVNGYTTISGAYAHVDSPTYVRVRNAQNGDIFDSIYQCVSIGEDDLVKIHGISTDGAESGTADFTLLTFTTPNT